MRRHRPRHIVGHSCMRHRPLHLRAALVHMNAVMLYCWHWQQSKHKNVTVSLNCASWEATELIGRLHAIITCFRAYLNTQANKQINMHVQKIYVYVGIYLYTYANNYIYIYLHYTYIVAKQYKTARYDGCSNNQKPVW